MRIYNINGNLTVVDSDTTAERIYPGQWAYLYDTTKGVSWADTDLDPQYHWIDTGPWRDRFGIDWLAITSSSNELCKAAAQLWIDRKYINLKDARNAQVLDAMIATSQPAANVLFAGSGPMTVDKKNAILNPVTTEYERHVKGMVQPS
jgi:hypothetical protein